MRGKAPAHQLRCPQAPACQCQIGAKAPRQPRKNHRGATVRDQANTGLRHGPDRALGGHPEPSIERKADTSAHDHTVPEGDLRQPWLHTSKAVDQSEGHAISVGGWHARNTFTMYFWWKVRMSKEATEAFNVASSGESPVTCTYHQNCSHFRMILPPVNDRLNLPVHIVVQGVEGLRPVQLDRPQSGRAVFVNIDLGLHSHQ
mmetsp:Transcript_47651/g.81970  ORF Transcript_47651/g.81970 Transcript_47651/m.81970 type:complete len:202 (+) Transcript_47651:379-984(+)